MSNIRNYKGYSASVECDNEEDIMLGRIVGISDNVMFHADNIEGLQAAFHEAVDSYIETCASIGRKPQKPKIP